MVDHRGIEPLTSRLRTWRSPEWVAYADEQAEELFFRLVKQLAEKEGITEQLKANKANNQMLWVARMNNIRNRATEIVNVELLYT